MSEADFSASDVYGNPELILESGKKYLICAESGHGKSSFLNFIYGVSHQYHGEVFMPVKSTTELRRSHLSYVFQDLKLFPELTVADNINLKNRLSNFASDAQIDEWLAALEIQHKCNEKVGVLSLGQQQRVAIVRALCQPFDFLLMDEPFSHLDPANRDRIAGLLEGELNKRNAGLLLTSLTSDSSFKYDKTLFL